MKINFEAEIKRQTGIEPTLRDVLRVMVAANRDRASVVRRATGARTAGVCVVLIGSEAIREVGPWCMTLAMSLRLPAPAAAVHNDVLADLSSQVKLLFDVADSTAQKWGWAPFTFEGRQSLLFYATAGVNEEFCRGLTERGCTTRPV